MEVERIWGRSAKMIMALFLLGTATVAIAFLPEYKQVGMISVFLLIACRLGQGIAWGGSWDGLPSLLAMNVPTKRVGWYTMIPQLGAMLGLFLSTTLFVYFITRLSAEDFLDWGWRYPFFVAFAINVVALFARLRIVSTPQYTRLFAHRALHPTPVFRTVKVQGRNVVIGALAPVASFALFHMVTLFPLSWVFLFTPQSPSRFLIIEALGSLVGAVCVMSSGWVADKVGRRMLLGVTAAIIATFSGFAPQLLNGGSAGEIAYMCVGFILLGFSFGQSSGVMASNFPSTYRYTGSALTSDLAWLFGAGFAPLTALWMSGEFGLPAAGVYLLSGAAMTSAALLWNTQLAKSVER
jgi:MFS family permease